MTVIAPHDDSQGHHDDGSHLAHHFDTPQQQFDAGKLGIWLFLTTEVLLFSGLFCAYAVYRANHPEVFAFAHLYLDKLLGATNTVVLLFSSLTMAWAVRAAQLGQKNLLVGLLSLTLLCGFGFLAIKTIEYKAKFAHGTLWGTRYDPVEMPNEKPPTAEDEKRLEAEKKAREAELTVTALSKTTAVGPSGNQYEQSKYAPASVGPQGVSPVWLAEFNHQKETADNIGENGKEIWKGAPPEHAETFFSIYFVMTGLHGVHVVAGMICIGWILKRSLKGEFGPKYFNPVDFVGLYWHIVDLVWIFLFPLLYLIGNQ